MAGSLASRSLLPRDERDRKLGTGDGTEVAWSVGFREQTHFTRMFRRISGVTPGQIRRAALQGQVKLALPSTPTT
ncbi:MAG: helix-turn-helix domain-containing protein [Gemmatimonadota bacterium]|nr:MAG: helix-turn-helix domain-containing protein [Gemmatimonadota bacterium]